MRRRHGDAHATDVVVPERFKNFRETRLSTVRPVGEFFDHHRISRPRDLNEAIQVR